MFRSTVSLSTSSDSHTTDSSIPVPQYHVPTLFIVWHVRVFLDQVLVLGEVDGEEAVRSFAQEWEDGLHDSMVGEVVEVALVEVVRRGVDAAGDQESFCREIDTWWYMVHLIGIKIQN